MSTYKEIGEAAAKLKDKGYTQTQIVKELERQGLSSTTGGKLHQTCVSVALRIRDGKYKPKKKKKTNTTGDIDTITFLTDVLSSNLTAQSKQRIVDSMMKR